MDRRNKRKKRRVERRKKQVTKQESTGMDRMKKQVQK
jgi:hypothetical protein